MEGERSQFSSLARTRVVDVPINQSINQPTKRASSVLVVSVLEWRSYEYEEQDDDEQ